MSTRIRRVRPGGTVVKNAGLVRAKDILNLISNIQQEMSELRSALDDNMGELTALMHEAKRTTLEDNGVIASLVRSSGKAQNIIDPKKLYKQLDGGDDFFSAVNVSVTQAKKLLGEKELSKITRHIPGTPGEEQLKITYVK